MTEGIPGGYVLKARRILESEVAHAAPSIREVWDYLILRAFWKSGDKVRRGELLTSYEEIRHALAWGVGYRKKRYSRWQCEHAMKWLTKRGMIATAKTTRGLRVTVINYARYQDPHNYERHTEDRNGGHTKQTDTRHDREEGETKKKSEEEEFRAHPPTPSDSMRSGKEKRQSSDGGQQWPWPRWITALRRSHQTCASLPESAIMASIAHCLKEDPGLDVEGVDEAIEAFGRQCAGSWPKPPLRVFEGYLRNAAKRRRDQEAEESADDRPPRDVYVPFARRMQGRMKQGAPPAPAPCPPAAGRSSPPVSATGTASGPACPPAAGPTLKSVTARDTVGADSDGRPER